MVPAGNKTKRLSSVNHTTKTIHHHHHHHHHHHEASHFGESQEKFKIWVLDHTFTYLLVVQKSYNDVSFISVNLTK